MLNKSTVYAVLVALTLAGYPFVAAVSSVIGIGSTLPSIVMRLLILFLGLTLVFWGKYRISNIHPMFFVYIIFWILYGFRIYYDTSFDSGSLSKPLFDYWIWAFGACLIPSLGLLKLKSTQLFEKSITYSFFLLFVASIFAVKAGSTLVVTVSETYDSGRFRLDSLNPISLGHLGVSLAIISAWSFTVDKNKKIIFIAAFFLGIYLAFASASRGPLLTLFFIGLLAACVAQGVKFIIAIILFAVFLFSFYQIAISFGDVFGFDTIGRIMLLFEGDDVNVSSRQLAIHGAWNQFLSSPFTGSSLEEYVTRMNPHNIIIEAFMSTGFFGGLFLAILVTYSSYIAIKNLRQKRSFGWLSLIYFQYLISAQFSGALYNVPTFWGFLAILIALGALKKKKNYYGNASVANV